MKSQKLSHGKPSTCVHTGFSLIEVLIVIALVGIILSMGMLIGQSSIGRSYVYAERDTLVSLLTTARAQSLANMNESAHGVYISSTSTTLFEGSSYLLRKKSQDRIVPNSSSVQTLPPPLYTMPYYILFAQVSGNVTNGSGTTTLTDGASSSTIQINTAGRINW